MSDPIIERMARAMETEHSRNPQYDYTSLARAALASLVPDGDALEAAVDAWQERYNAAVDALAAHPLPEEG